MKTTLPNNIFCVRSTGERVLLVFNIQYLMQAPLFHSQSVIFSGKNVISYQKDWRQLKESVPLLGTWNTFFLMPRCEGCGDTDFYSQTVSYSFFQMRHLLSLPTSHIVHLG